MTDITNILYWVSSGLLIPVVVVLLIGFVRSLTMAGGFVGQYINRLKLNRAMEKLTASLKEGQRPGAADAQTFKGNPIFRRYLKRILEEGRDGVLAEKALADFETDSEKELATARSLSRIGPMVGLMGTLIPMGPALLGLSTGDIASMAQNMQVAFSTTVVGLLIGAIGYAVHLVRQRWFVEDMNNLEFIHQFLHRPAVTGVAVNRQANETEKILSPGTEQ